MLSGIIPRKDISMGLSERTVRFCVSTVVLLVMVQEKLVSTSEASCQVGFVLVPIIPDAPKKDIPSRCYKFYDEKSTFEIAIQKCEADNSILASPKNSIYSESLARYILKNRPFIKRYWIGLTDQETEGVFEWEGGRGELSANFSSWMATEPESKIGAEPGSRGDEQDCVKMAIWVYGRQSSARYYDTHCEKLEAFVCEHEMRTEPKESSSAKDTEEGSTAKLPAWMRKGENSSAMSEKEVDFIVPKDAKNVLRNKNKGAGRNETTEDPHLIELVAYGADYAEDDEGSIHNRYSVLNSTTKMRPQSSDPARNTEKSIFGSGADLQLKKNARQNKTITTRRRRLEKRNCRLTCMPSFMRAACPLKYFPQIQHTRVVLNNATCRPRRNRTHLIVHTRLDDCGTTVQNTEKGNKVSFRNTLKLIPRGSGIVRSQKLATALTEFMLLDCRYPQQHSVSQTFHPAEGRPQVYKTIEEGPSLSHQILLYKSGKYDCPFAREDYPVEIVLSERVYLEVTLDMPSERVELHPVTCFATPDPNPYNSNNYVMMQDGCIEDNTFRIEESDSRKVSRLSVEAFRFVGYFRKVFIHCNFIVCSMNSESSPQCPYACNPETRYRRSAEDEIDEDARHIMSHTGMINIVDDGKITDEDDDSKDDRSLVSSDVKQKAEQENSPGALQSQQGTDEHTDDKGNSGTGLSARVLLVIGSSLPRLILDRFER